MVVKGQVECGSGHRRDSHCWANEACLGLLVSFRIINIEEQYFRTKQMNKIFDGCL